jgi:hypothetical protein
MVKAKEIATNNRDDEEENAENKVDDDLTCPKGAGSLKHPGSGV